MDHNRCHWLISLEVDFLFICRPHLCLIADHIVFILSNTVNNDIFCKIFALTNRCNPQALILVDIYFKTAILRGTIIHFVVAKTTSIYTEVDSTVAFCPFKKNREPIEINRFAVVRREGFEPPAFWSVGCLTHKSGSFRLRFVLFATVRSADFPLFPSSPARFFRILGQKWVRGC